MGLMTNVLNDLENECNIKSLYRYQGNNVIGNSFKHVIIDKTQPNIEMDFKNNIYFSKSYDHHKYFIRKKLKTGINKILIDNRLPIINKYNMSVLDNYNQILCAVIDNYELFNNESIHLVFSNKLLNLIKENSIKQEDKIKGLNLPELADRRKNGGAYGISNDWLELLNNLTLFYKKINIDYNDVLNYLYKVKLNYLSNRKWDVVQFLDEKIPTTYINEYIYCPYHKYKILENMETIIQNKNYIKNSNLHKHPTKTIKEIIEDYKILRENILNNLEKEYDKKILRLKP